MDHVFFTFKPQGLKTEALPCKKKVSDIPAEEDRKIANFFFNSVQYHLNVNVTDTLYSYPQRTYI
jgi:hypothetical protein